MATTDGQEKDSDSEESDEQAYRKTTVEKLGCCMVNHNNKWRMRWDLYVMLLAIWNCISIPFEVAFSPEYS
jgi:hypothetical protein